jgi:glycerol uptake facilitator-like aquaporin
MSGDLPRRLLAEAIGTGMLVMFGAGSVVAALTLGGGELDPRPSWRLRSTSARPVAGRA